VKKQGTGNSEQGTGVGARMDKQQIGLIGKHILIADLIAADLEVAEPLRDRGIDLIAFRDGIDGGEFEACPIQLKTASSATFSVDKKYEHFSDLRIVYVWKAKNPVDAEFYCLTYPESIRVLKAMNGAQFSSVENTGHWVSTNPSGTLKKKLKDFQVKEPKDWPSRLGMTEPSAASPKSKHR
jgi:hypothetical protein